MGLPDMWQPLIVLQTCSEKAIILAGTNANDWSSSGCAWVVICALTINPTGLERIQIAEHLLAVPWRFDGLGLVDPQSMYCI